MTAARDADSATAADRLAKANQFAEAAAVLFDERSQATAHPDAYVTQAIHAGIAAADVICIIRLGQYSANAAHHEAVALLKRANPTAANHLSRLLGLKTKAGYSAASVSSAEVTVAHRAHLALLEAAREA